MALFFRITLQLITIVFLDNSICSDIRSRFGSNTVGDHGHGHGHVIIVLTIFTLTQNTVANNICIR